MSGNYIIRSLTYSFDCLKALLTYFRPATDDSRRYPCNLALECDLVRPSRRGAHPHILVGPDDWYRRFVLFFPHNLCLRHRLIAFFSLTTVNMIVHASFCQSGFSATNYSQLCKGTDIAAPVLSILVNVSVMVLTLWKAWSVLYSSKWFYVVKYLLDFGLTSLY